MNKNKLNLLERIFESLLWKSRLIVIAPVIFSLLAAFALFFAGSFEIFHTIKHMFPEGGHEPSYPQLLIGIIGAIDLYLIGIVLLIFAFGVYELFISKIDIAHAGNQHNILEITTLDELKNKLIKVIIMVLIVSFFKTILSTNFQTPIEMLYFGLAILAVASCTFFMRKLDHEE